MRRISSLTRITLSSLPSYLKTLRREGWKKMPGVDPENMFKTFAIQKTPDGMMFEGEGDDLRDADQVKQMDKFRKVSSPCCSSLGFRV